MPAVAKQIHHGERKVVEHIDRGNRRIELDRVEQNRLVLDQHDVRQMQVAMATPHISLFGRAAPATARIRENADLRRLLEAVHIAGGKTGCGSECCGIVAR